MTLCVNTVHIKITGLVQGVYFRAWTAAQAEKRGLSGWVRNRRDGSVEALFHGAADEVAAMIDACRQGPRDARVEAIEIIQEGGAAPSGFEIQATV